MGCGIIEELGDDLGCGFGAFGLFGGNGAKGNYHGGVDGSTVEKEGAYNFLNMRQ
jgi:hypothetical protein